MTSLPRPAAADIALATAWIDDEYRLTVCPTYFAKHRSELIRQAAMFEMGKRQDAEFRARAVIIKTAEHFRGGGEQVGRAA
jgi:hypothetical protein